MRDLPRPFRPALRSTLLLALLITAGAAGGAVPPAPDWPPPGRELPAELVGGRFELVLKTADGEPLRLFTDTGGGLAMRASAVERLGGDPEAGSFELPRLDPADAIPQPPAAFAVMPDDKTPKGFPDGLVGGGWFAGRAWTFDYPGERLLLVDEPFEVPEALLAHTVPLGFQRGDDGEVTTGFARISADLAGEPVDLLFDTGATGYPPPAFGRGDESVAVSFIVRSRAERWRAEHPEWLVVAKDGKAPGAADEALPGEYWIRVPEVSVAGLEVGPVWFDTRPDANFHDWMSQWMDRRVEGALGGNALARLVVTADYPRARATFAPPERREGRVSLPDLTRGSRLEDLGLDAFRAGHHAEAGRLLARAAGLLADPRGAWYNAACSYALAGDPDAAFAALGQAVDAGLAATEQLAADPDLGPLHDDPRWAGVVAAVAARRESRSGRLHDPDAARLVTEDIGRFWRAYDEAAGLESVDEVAAVLARDYLEPGSRGLLQFFVSRIGSAEALARTVLADRPYYDAIRANTRLPERQEPAIRQAFHRLQEIFPEAEFPDVYFLIGRLNSGGTTSADALLIGSELFAVGGDVPESAIPEHAAALVKPVTQLPYIVSHELIHVQQQQNGGAEGGGSLLDQALAEGGADFLAGLIRPSAGWEPNYRAWGRAHERQVWERFVAEKDGAESGDWFYNYGRPGDSWHPDLGYYVGFEIARGYYEQADDKRAAVRALIRLDDPQAIYDASGYAHRFVP